MPGEQGHKCVGAHELAACVKLSHLAQVLRAGNTGRTDDEERLRAVRYQIVKRTQEYDYQMYLELSQAEGRLGQARAFTAADRFIVATRLCWLSIVGR